ncbi:unnamed protein product [Rhizoctonia solani]|uniref:Peptidase M43 pregnancy-associated plasma-A domain-containing protein n=1 Tax=Rhizoctonia solani TaxID=456999 RepID=A0A8H3BNW4_9AGAM|nr:unnamed protein product [Rhizoctonia solani]
MVLIRFLTATFALVAGSFAFALPSHNATLSRSDPGSVLCGEGHLSLLGFPKADESLIASNAQAQDVFNQEVPVFWRVIYKDETYEGGYLDSSQIHKGLDALNDQFVGHRLGLHHTFEKGCYGEGDEVAEILSSSTPAEIDALFGCPIGCNTCLGPGEDSIHNYMDYTNESCKTHPFTLSHIARMRTIYELYRKDK